VSKETASTKSKNKIQINLDWCKGCGICVSLCPKGILEPFGLDQKVRVTDESACIRCKMCEMHCPDFAIEVKSEADDERQR
jgi:2-oxoglutarate ferredoxin oxidoreductase subunit delta